MNYKYPVYQPSLQGNEKIYVLDCLDSTWISSKGKYINQFEEQFAQKIGSKHAATVSNGTVALHVALVALGIGPNDEVIVPTFTYIASVNAIAYTGAKPVFVDSEMDSWQMNAQDIISKITSKTKAIMAVHLYGSSCDMDAIVKIAKEHSLLLIEDCAESFGTYYKNIHTGNFGDIATFSFFGNKTITTGEGGMVTTNNAALHEKVMHYKGQGLAKNREYWHDVVGFNYRMTNICAAIGVAQLEQADVFISKKIQIANWYKKYIQSTDVHFQEEKEYIKNSYWMCSIAVNTEEIRDALRKHLADMGIETRPFFHPAHVMPIYKEDTIYPVSEHLSKVGINIPSYPQLLESDIEYISTCINSYFENKNV
ncbi:DegT/DnrJ/EryC1/StrS aminotransferase family protein [uncultured Cytophaga sp.]|uniref:DegT/DnrJ/EryC1/StrS family aminotransferase n=1 Tax=uncultured Cytophaga sp. TaxID=160238 RepID=UPI00262E28E5|nr:DegT/DnrJ/EryC1/StrS aminotransferase family protein [uncultured Cytophaga sp.]